MCRDRKCFGCFIFGPTEPYPGFPCGSPGKEVAYDAGALGSISGLRRSPGEEKAYPLQYFAWRTPGTEELGRL